MVSAYDIVQKRDIVKGCIDFLICEQGSMAETVLLTDEDCKVIIKALSECVAQYDYMLQSIVFPGSITEKDDE